MLHRYLVHAGAANTRGCGNKTYCLRAERSGWGNFHAQQQYQKVGVVVENSIHLLRVPRAQARVDCIRKICYELHCTRRQQTQKLHLALTRVDQFDVGCLVGISGREAYPGGIILVQQSVLDESGEYRARQCTAERETLLSFSTQKASVSTFGDHGTKGRPPTPG